MAGVNLAAITAALNLKYSDPISNQFRRDIVLANLIECEPEANSSCTWDAKFAARNTAGPKAEGYEVQSSDFSTDTRKQATLSWAHYEGYASVTGTAQRIAKANGRDGQADKVGEEITDALEELSVKVGQHTYSGNVSNTPVEIEGLARAVDSTGTYAGINQAVDTDWASGENSIATADLSLANIREKLFRPFRDATGRNPNVVMAPGAVMDSVAGLFDTAIEARYIASPRGQIDVAALGFRAYMVEGVPFVEDRHCTASTMYALDLSQLRFRQIPPDWTSMDPNQLQGLIKELNGQTVEITDIQAMQAAARKRLSFQINALSKTGDSTRLQLVSDFQLRLRRRQAASKLYLT